jgi:hypothetical protein
MKRQLTIHALPLWTVVCFQEDCPHKWNENKDDTGHEETDAWKIGRSQQEETMDTGNMQQQPLHMGSSHPGEFTNDQVQQDGTTHLLAWEEFAIL